MEDKRADEESQATQYVPNTDIPSQPPLEGEEAGSGDEETPEITPPGASAIPPNGSAPQDGLTTRFPNRGLAEEDGAGSPEHEHVEPEKPEADVALADREKRGVDVSEVGRGRAESPNARPGKLSEAAGGARTPADKGTSSGDGELGVAQTADEPRTDTLMAVRRTIPSGRRDGSATFGSWDPPRGITARAAQRAREVRLARQIADRDGVEESLAQGRRLTPSTARLRVTQGSQRLVAEGNSTIVSSVEQATVSDARGAEASVKSVQASSRKRGGR